MNAVADRIGNAHRAVVGKGEVSVERPDVDGRAGRVRRAHGCDGIEQSQEIHLVRQRILAGELDEIAAGRPTVDQLVDECARAGGAAGKTDYVDPDLSDRPGGCWASTASLWVTPSAWIGSSNPLMSPLAEASHIVFAFPGEIRARDLSGAIAQ